LLRHVRQLVRDDCVTLERPRAILARIESDIAADGEGVAALVRGQGDSSAVGVDAHVGERASESSLDSRPHTAVERTSGAELTPDCFRVGVLGGPELPAPDSLPDARLHGGDEPVGPLPVRVGVANDSLLHVDG
jgi:hypothetical protein